MSFLGFKPCLHDLDAWTRPAIKANGDEHYERVLLYADNALVARENAEKFLRNEIGKNFELEPNSVGPSR